MPNASYHTTPIKMPPQSVTSTPRSEVTGSGLIPCHWNGTTIEIGEPVGLLAPGLVVGISGQVRTGFNLSGADPAGGHTGGAGDVYNVVVDAGDGQYVESYTQSGITLTRTCGPVATVDAGDPSSFPPQHGDNITVWLADGAMQAIQGCNVGPVLLGPVNGILYAFKDSNYGVHLEVMTNGSLIQPLIHLYRVNPDLSISYDLDTMESADFGYGYDRLSVNPPTVDVNAFNMVPLFGGPWLSMNDSTIIAALTIPPQIMFPFGVYGAAEYLVQLQRSGDSLVKHTGGFRTFQSLFARGAAVLDDLQQVLYDGTGPFETSAFHFIDSTHFLTNATVHQVNGNKISSGRTISPDYSEYGDPGSSLKHIPLHLLDSNHYFVGNLGAGADYQVQEFDLSLATPVPGTDDPRSLFYVSRTDMPALPGRWGAGKAGTGDFVMVVDGVALSRGTATATQKGEVVVTTAAHTVIQMPKQSVTSTVT